LISVGSLESLVEVATEDYQTSILSVGDWSRALLIPMIDARRMEVYTCIFDSQGNALNSVEAKIIDADSFAEQRVRAQAEGTEIIIFGDGASKCRELLSDVRYVDVVPSARGLARLAQRAFEQQRFEDIAYFEPFYLKDFVVTQSKKNLLVRK
jgi:tRNA threonylcarbamoyladenosine biosynthesis protein TsaB